MHAHVLQCYSFPDWMFWQMRLLNTVSSALCFASFAVGHGQVQGEERQERGRDVRVDAPQEGGDRGRSGYVLVRRERKKRQRRA